MSNLKKSFTAFLALNGLMQLGLGILMLADFQAVVTSMFGLDFHEDMSTLGVVLAMNVLFAGAIPILSVVWTIQRERKGASLGMLFGWYVAVVGIVSFGSLGIVEGLWIDVPRGLTIVVLGYLVQRQDDAD